MNKKNTLEYLYSLPPLFKWNGQYNPLILEKAVELCEFDGDWCEFGVFEGRDARILEKKLPENTKLFLFDSFEGLATDWIVNKEVFHIEGHPVVSESGIWKEFSKGCFKTNNIPKFENPNVKMIIGDVTIGATIYHGLYSYGKEKPMSFIHMDLDLFFPTYKALVGVSNFIQTGTIILFDDYYNYGGDGWLEHEFRAFKNFLKSFPEFDFEYLFREDKFRVCVRMIR